MFPELRKLVKCTPKNLRDTIGDKNFRDQTIQDKSTKDNTIWPEL